MGDRPGLSHQGLHVGGCLRRIINRSWLLKGITYRWKGGWDGVSTLLLLESFKLILQEFQAIISLREVEKEPLKLNQSQTKHELSTRNKPGSEQKKTFVWKQNRSGVWRSRKRKENFALENSLGTRRTEIVRNQSKGGTLDWHNPRRTLRKITIMKRNYSENVSWIGTPKGPNAQNHRNSGVPEPRNGALTRRFRDVQ